jgi:hypothetical protein
LISPGTKVRDAAHFGRNADIGVGPRSAISDHRVLGEGFNSAPTFMASRTGGGAVHSIRSGRFDFMAPGIDVDQFAIEEMRYL